MLESTCLRHNAYNRSFSVEVYISSKSSQVRFYQEGTDEVLCICTISLRLFRAIGKNATMIQYFTYGDLFAESNDDYLYIEAWHSKLPEGLFIKMTRERYNRILACMNA